MAMAMMGLGGLLFLGGFIVCFVLALKSKRLPTWGIVLGVTTFWCGCGTIPFLAIAWNAMQKGVFADVAAGQDPVEARAALGRFKVAAAACIIGLVVGMIGARSAGYG